MARGRAGRIRAMTSSCRLAKPSSCAREPELTVVSWGAMVERCEQAADESSVDVELLDLRTLMPWDREAVLASVRKTRRCLIVHEDKLTAGFGAEIAAVAGERGFLRPRRADRARRPCRTCRARTARCCSTRWCRALRASRDAIRQLASL